MTAGTTAMHARDPHRHDGQPDLDVLERGAVSRPPLDANLSESAVMMVDDEPLLLQLVEAFLAEGGWTDFHGESDPLRAMERLHRSPPDVLLLDLMMPGMSGFEVLRRVRADPVMQRLPVVVMTGSDDPAVKLRALELGATDFLEKPVDPSELLLRLRNTLAFKAYRDRSEWYDPITGLPNRRKLLGRLATLLRAGRQEDACHALLKIQVGNLARLNETLGHRWADHAMRLLAERAGLCVAEPSPGLAAPSALPAHGTAMPFRIAPDSLAVLLPGLTRIELAASLAGRLLDSLGLPIDVDGQDWYPQVSIGIAAAPDDAADPEALLRCASSAASVARGRPGSSIGFYSARLDERARERMRTEAQLRRAIDRGEFELHYQPKVDPATRRVVGCEALVRWRHPELGLLSPAHFVPIAEESGLIGGLDGWVVAEACRAAKRWLDAGMPCPVAVNVAGAQLQGGRLLDEVIGVLVASGLPPELLCIELTETTLMTGGPQEEETLRRLRRLGVSIALDDFGTGYSSFSYLKRMTIDELKIDRSLVVGLPDDAAGAAIVRAIVDLSNALRIPVVAEGVETDPQADFLRDIGCARCQGWLYAPAMPEAAFVDLIRLGSL